MRYATYVLAALLTLSTSNLFAEEEEHGHSDVEFEYVGGMIEIEFGDEGPVYEVDLPTTNVDFSEQATDDPGFFSEVADGLGVNSGDIIDFNILGPLVFHDGTDFAPVPAGALIQITDNGVSAGTLDVTASTSGPVSGPGIVGEADAGGDIHIHMDYALLPLSLDTPEYGAYGILMELTTDEPGIDNSDPFYIVFNFGLDEEIFEGAVGDFAASIPEPTAAILLAVGASFFAAARRR